MKDRITVFSIDITIKIPLRFFAFRLCRCSTVKSRSKREKLSLKTLIIPRVRLAIEFGSFFIYATILSFSLTSGIATLTRTYVCFSRCYSVFAERLIKSGLRTCRRGALEQKAYFARVHKRERGFASGRNMFLRAKRTRAAYQYRNEPPLRSCNRQGAFGRRKFLAEDLARRNRGKLPAASNRRKTYHRIRGRQSGIVQEIFARDRRKNRL